MKNVLYLPFLRDMKRDIPKHISCVTSSVTCFDEKMVETCYATTFFFSVTTLRDIPKPLFSEKSGLRIHSIFVKNTKKFPFQEKFKKSSRVIKSATWITPQISLFLEPTVGSLYLEAVSGTPRIA